MPLRMFQECRDRSLAKGLAFDPYRQDAKYGERTSNKPPVTKIPTTSP